MPGNGQHTECRYGWEAPGNPKRCLLDGALCIGRQECQRGKEEKHTMIVRIERGIKNGDQFMNIMLDGNNETWHQASRKLTGTTNESGNGIFQSVCDQHPIMFQYREQHADFSWPVFVFHDHTLQECVDEIKRRVFGVTEWRKHQDYTESIEFDCNEYEVDSRR